MKKVAFGEFFGFIEFIEFIGFVEFIEFSGLLVFIVFIELFKLVLLLSFTVSRRSRRRWVFFSTRNSQLGQEEKGIYCLKFSTWNQSSTSMVKRILGLVGFIEVVRSVEIVMIV